MNGESLREARGLLAEIWGLPQPVSMASMGRILGLQGRDPGNTIRDWERRDGPSGPAALAINLMLNGAIPPNLLEVMNADLECEDPEVVVYDDDGATIFLIR